MSMPAEIVKHYSLRSLNQITITEPPKSFEPIRKKVQRTKCQSRSGSRPPRRRTEPDAEYPTIYLPSNDASRAEAVHRRNGQCNANITILTAESIPFLHLDNPSPDKCQPAHESLPDYRLENAPCVLLPREARESERDKVSVHCPLLMLMSCEKSEAMEQRKHEKPAENKLPTHDEKKNNNEAFLCWDSHVVGFERLGRIVFVETFAALSIVREASKVSLMLEESLSVDIFTCNLF
ncbi:hypothetical protein TSAR_006731 [Trichomalopsis sarcophagae]|uniref:Uncharacterized protein n=1 Tax=Trichomalopsis sarcophagae TaxID=543379 RepID=A0A232FBZ6_9HYME|nr:hypothetical protein TSAR_006731 [Trichomalopsis sarcophagae]